MAGHQDIKRGLLLFIVGVLLLLLALTAGSSVTAGGELDGDVASPGPVVDITGGCVDGVITNEITLSGFDASGTNHIRAVLETSNGGSTKRDVVDEDFGESFHVVQTSVRGTTRGSGSLDIDTWNGENEVHTAGTVGPGYCPAPSPEPPPTPVPPSATVSRPCEGSRHRWTLRAGGDQADFSVRAKVWGKGWRLFARHLAGGDTFTSPYRRLVVGSRLTIRASGLVRASKIIGPGNSRRCPR